MLCVSGFGFNFGHVLNGQREHLLFLWENKCPLIESVNVTEKVRFCHTCWRTTPTHTLSFTRTVLFSLNISVKTYFGFGFSTLYLIIMTYISHTNIYGVDTVWLVWKYCMVVGCNIHQIWRGGKHNLLIT